LAFVNWQLSRKGVTTMERWETAWQFKTRNLRITLDIAECLDDPTDQFEAGDQTVQDIRNGRIAWFDARVRISTDGQELGADYLGGCAYGDISDFYTDHRSADPLHRNSSIMRASRGSNVVICHYFPSMVSEACRRARKTLAHLKSLELRVS
jgi:hypothetical protein